MGQLFPLDIKIFVSFFPLFLWCKWRDSIISSVGREGKKCETGEPGEDETKENKYKTAHDNSCQSRISD